MIASLKGKIIETFANYLILEVNGVGYKVEGNFDNLSKGNDLFIFIHSHYSENDTRLFGFLDKEDYLLFELLLTVSGIGPKSALSLLHGVGASKIREAIIKASPQDLKGRGIGIKSAQKIVIELAGKIDGKITKEMQIHSQAEEKKLNEVLSALTGLGYSRYEIDQIWDKLPSTQDMKFETLLRSALTLLQSKNN